MRTGGRYLEQERTPRHRQKAPPHRAPDLHTAAGATISARKYREKTPIIRERHGAQRILPEAATERPLSKGRIKHAKEKKP